MARTLPWRRRGRSSETGEHGELTRALSVAEAAAVRQNMQIPPSRGYIADIPYGGTTRYNAGFQGQTDRREFLQELYGAYLACPWASACVDTIAETATAGGLIIAPENDLTQDEQPKPTPEVLAVQDLLDFVNPREDSRELSRGGLQDLGIFGDAFFELVWFAGRVVAVYSLDAPSMIPLADEHGTVSGYHQNLDGTRTVDFDPHEVIQVSLDSPRGGLYGVGPTQKCLLPITAWLFTEGLLKETMRKGNPKPIHVDFPLSTDEGEIIRWRQKYQVQNLGIANLGAPLTSKGGTSVAEMSENAIAEYVATLTNLRDTILSGYGVPPAQVGVIESGNLGGGTGTSQEKVFRVNTCGPIAEAFLEKFTFHLLQQAFGVTGWRAKFGEVDWRDDKAVEDIRDTRIRNGTWTINRARTEVGEKPVDGGDDPVLVNRQDFVLVSDLPTYSKAAVGALQAKGIPAQQADQDAGLAPIPAPSAPNSTDDRTESRPAVGVTESRDGVMVALFPPAELAASLARPDGLPPEDLHVTLAYLGSDDVDMAAVNAIVAAWALTTAPMLATVSGIGLFAPSDTSDGDPVTYASIDCPGLESARERLVELLCAAGLPVSQLHGFTPHMTLAYVNVVGDGTSPAGSWPVGTATVCQGAERSSFELTASAESAWIASYTERRRQVLAELSA